MKFNVELISRFLGIDMTEPEQHTWFSLPGTDASQPTYTVLASCCLHLLSQSRLLPHSRECNRNQRYSSTSMQNHCHDVMAALNCLTITLFLAMFTWMKIKASWSKRTGFSNWQWQRLNKVAWGTPIALF